MLFTLKYTLSFDFTKNIPVLVRNEKQSSLSSRSLLSGRGQVWLVLVVLNKSADLTKLRRKRLVRWVTIQFGICGRVGGKLWAVIRGEFASG